MLPELNSGGVERGTIEIGNYLASKGHDSIVISSGGRLVPELEYGGSRHIRLEVASKSPLTAMSSLKLKKIIENERPDILHLRSRVPAWVANIALKMLDTSIRPAVVSTFHGFHSVNPYSAIMASGDLVIAVSRIICEHIEEHYGKGRNIRIIPRGVDLSVFSEDAVSAERKNEARKKLGIESATGPFVMLPARFTRLKGHELFIKALSGIKDLPWTAVLVGDHSENTSYCSEIESLAVSLGIRDRIVFGGFSNDMPAAISLCDVVVSSSVRPESFGRTAVEAMAMARPVVVPGNGGFGETVVNDLTGLFYHTGDDRSFSDCLRTLLSSEEKRKTMGVDGRKRVARYFTLENMCRKTEEAYLEIRRRKILKNSDDR